MSRARILADYVSGGATAAEFDYLDGVTSNIQTQFTAKAALASPAFTGTPTGITAAHITSGVLPVGVTGGSGLDAVSTGIDEFDSWRMTVSFFGTSSKTYFYLNWTRDTGGFTKLGTGMTKPVEATTSGDEHARWKFPSTGHWLIDFHTAIYDDEYQNFILFHIEYSTDTGSSWSVGTQGSMPMDGTAGNVNLTIRLSKILDITNIETHFVRFALQHHVDGQARIIGESDYNYTWATFTRLGDT